MEKFEFISETFQDDEDNPSAPWGAPCYLILRKANPLIKENGGLPGFARLICDFSQGLNKILEPTPALVKGIEPVIESLRGGFLFSLIDLKQSYYGLVIDESSYKYTQCVAPPGRSFVWKRLPMGASSAPASLLEKVNLILNYIPKRDAKGNIMFQPGENPDDPTAKAILLPNKIQHVVHFYDDILVFTPKSKKPESEKFEHSIDEHFQAVRKLAERMSLFQLKVTFHKCSWSRRYVDFLGWHIRDDIITADPKRISKVTKFEFPINRKQMLGFLGLINTLKRVSPLPAGEELALLTELASTKNKYVYSEKHITAFNRVKELLTSQPLYCQMVDPAADKIIFVDASSLAYGSVLLTRLNDNNQPVFSSHISQDDRDPLNQVIRQWDLKLFIGERYADFSDSFYRSILFLAKYHNLNLSFDTVTELRQGLIKYTQKSIIGAQVKEQHCDSKHSVFVDFLYSRIGNYEAAVSDTDVVLHLMSSFLGRGLNIYRADMHSQQLPLYEVLPEGHASSTAEPFSLGVYPTNTNSNAGNFVPLLCFKHWEFNPSLLNSKYCVNFYDSKIIPVEHRNRSILELEATALLYALKKYQAYITNCNTYVVTDNRSLFYMFSQSIVQSHAKISRYNMKLQSDYPGVKVLWCSTEVNLADLFTRFGLQIEYEQKIKFRHCKIDDMPNIPSGTILSWHDMEEIASKHPKAVKVLLDYSQTYNTKHKGKLEKIKQIYQGTERETEMRPNNDGKCDKIPSEITLETQSDKHDQQSTSLVDTLPRTPGEGGHGASWLRETVQIRQLQVSTEQVRHLVTPIETLRERLSPKNISLAQQKYMKALYFDLLNTAQHSIRVKNITYKLVNNTIYVIKKKEPDTYLLAIPTELEPLVLSYIHLLRGHTSRANMIIEIKTTYFFMEGRIYEKVTLFNKACMACAINTRDTTLVPLATFLLNPDTRPFAIITADLAENLTAFLRYFRHLLVVKCLSTGYTVCFPLKSKTADAVCYHLLFGIMQNFGPIERLYTDNGKVFRKHETLQLLTALRIKVETTVALDSKSRGIIERSIRSVKTLIKKLLYADIRRDPNVIDILPFLATMCLNQSYNSRFGATPYNLIFGRNYSGDNLFTNLHKLPKLHPELQRSSGKVSQLKEIIDYENKNVRKFIKKAQERSKKAVRRPIKKQLPEGSLVYILDHGSGPVGVSQAMKPYYEKSVYVVLKEYLSHVALMRLVDQSIITRSKNEVKLVQNYPRINEVPEEIRKILKKHVTQLSQEDLDEIAKIDGFESFEIDSSHIPPDVYADDYADADVPLPNEIESQSEEDNPESESEEEEEEEEDPANIGRRYPKRNRTVKFQNLKF